VTVRVYLVQHGKARSADEDPNRGLSDEGREDVALAAHFLKNRRISVALIQHSGKMRAEQTAHILAEHIRCGAGPSTTDGMNPEDEPEVLANFLQVYDDDILIVGHLPNLERVTSILLTGHADRRPVHFSNAGVVCLEKTGGRAWSVLWAITPDLLKLMPGALAA
jgi:phosphohistidine phosphatase